MNKTQLIEALSAHFDGNRRAAQHALESVTETITREVSKRGGGKVAITGFGVFESVTRPARMVRNPATGERLRAKKTTVPKFRPGSDLKAVVSGAKKMPKATTTGTRASSPSSGGTSTARKSSGSAAAAKSTGKKAPAKKASTSRQSSTTKKAPAKKSSAATRSGAAKKGTAKKSSAAKSTGSRSARKTTKKS